MQARPDDLMQLCLLLGERRLEQSVIDGLAGRGIDCRVAGTLTEAERSHPVGGYDLLVVDAVVYGSESPAACRRLQSSWPDAPVLLLTDPAVEHGQWALEPDWLVMPCSDRLHQMLPHLLALMAERLISQADSTVSRAVLQAVMDAVDDGLSLANADGVTLYQNAAARVQSGVISRMPLRDARGVQFGELHRSTGSDDVRAYEPARDPGTGLVCREVLVECLGHALARVSRSGGRSALLLLDLRQTAGISVNDPDARESLNATGRNLAYELRRGDLVARIAPTVFAIVLEGVETIAETARVAQKLLRSTRQHTQCQGRIGIAISPDDGGSPDELVAAAEAAASAASFAAEPHYAYSTPEAAGRIARFLILSEGLEHALENDELELHFQPQFDLATGDVKGFEALLRWEHPGLGQVSPAEFIPVMERNGLINDAGAWVIRTACKQIARWQEEFMRPDLSIAVNLSSRQLEDDSLVSIVRRSLSETGIEPASLELEVTESLLMADPEQASRTLRRLEKLGMHVAIDDFGTGYSSLAYLKMLPVSALKIDRSFMQGVPENEKDVSVMRGTIMLAKGLGLKVTAEGVEREEQVESLRAYDCDRVQGFLFGKPGPERAARKFLEKKNGA